MPARLHSTVALTLCGMGWCATTAYYILLGTVGASILPAASYAEASVRFAQPTIISDVASVNNDNAPPLFLAPNFVPLFTPIENSANDETDDGDDDDTIAPTAQYLFIPKDSGMVDRAKRAIIEAQEVLADIMKEPRNLEKIERQQQQKLEDAQREEMLTDRLEYANRADRLRKALIERISPSQNIATLNNERDDDDAAQPTNERSLERILIPSSSIHVSDVEPITDGADNGSENILYRKVVEMPTVPFLVHPDDVIVQKLYTADDNEQSEDVKAYRGLSPFLF